MIVGRIISPLDYADSTNERRQEQAPLWTRDFPFFRILPADGIRLPVPVESGDFGTSPFY